MGGTSGKVAVKSSMPSPSVFDGRLSVVSDALDEFADFDTFWTELVNLIKAPGQMPAPVLAILQFQGSELVEDAGTDFKTIETYAGIKAIKKHYVDKTNRVVITETYYQTEEVLDNKVILVLHKDPMRIECWGEKTERVSHILRLDTMMGTVVRAVRGFFSRPRARIADNVPSRDSSGGLSCMSEPLGEHGTADSVFEALVQWQRSAQKREWVVKTEVVDPSDTEFTIREHYPVEVIQALFQKSVTGELSSTTRKCTVDNVQRKLTIELRLQDGSLVATGYAVIHDNPVQFEFWHVRADGTRETGDGTGFAREMLDGALGRDGAFKGLARSNVLSRVSPDLRSAMSYSLDHVSDFETIWSKIREISDMAVIRPDWAKSQELVSEDKARGERNFKLITDDDREVLRKIVTDVEGGRINDAYMHEGEVFESRWLAIHKEPLQVELWEEHKRGDGLERRSGPYMALKLQEILNGLLGFKPPKTIRFDTAASPSNPNLKSILSDPLDDVLDFDFLWDTILFTACTMKPRDFLKTVEIVDAKPNDFVFKETYHESFTQTFGRGADFFTLCSLHHEKSRGLISTSRQFNNVRFQHTLKVHTEPLRIEIWQDYDERRHGDTLRGLCQVYVDEILRRIGKTDAER